MNACEMIIKQRKFMLVVLAVALFGLMLAACGGSDIARTVPAGAQPGDLTLEPCKFKMDADEYDADCGTLVVPENRNKPSSRLIALPVVRIRATASDPAEPIFFLEGGPGQSNIVAKPPAWLLANHDFVKVGYRGVDGSAVLGCPEYTQALGGVGDDLLSADSLANLGEAMTQCVDRLKNAGVDLEGYTIPEVVADMEAARDALGYERVNVLSHSYGTRVAQVYMYLHPERLYRVAMLGPGTPGHMVFEPETIDAQLGYYARLCAQDAECSARTPNLAETIRKVAHDLPRRWLFLPIDPGRVRVITFLLLDSTRTTPIVFDAYLAAEQGDPSGLALMSLVYDFLLPSFFTWGDLFAKGSIDYDPARNYLAELDPPESILGSPFPLLLFGGAGRWPVPAIADELRRVQPSDVQTLLVSGSIDFRGPAEFVTEELSPHLTNGQQIILAEMGHVSDLWILQPEATERLLTSFYDTGVADDSLYTYAPMDFGVSLGAPTLAKIMLGIVLLLIAVVGMVIWFIVRRIRRRMARRRSQDAA